MTAVGRPRSARRALTTAALTTAVALVVPATAAAFGTMDGFMDQNAEHERITRVLACDSSTPPERCFQPESISQLAGRKGILGGVGLPDNPAEILGHPEAHCDDGDFLPGGPYDPSRAKPAAEALRACAEHFDRRMKAAVDEAAGMLDAGGNVLPGETDMATDCDFKVAIPGELEPALAARVPRAKCRVFYQLGRALHTAEDFWSHSNWTDQARPNQPVILRPAIPAGNPDGLPESPPIYNLQNPQGLGRSGSVLFLRYPVRWDALPTVEDELAGTAPISGCDDSPQKIVDWGNKIRDLIGSDRVVLCPGRVGHSVLNKDKGMIDPRTGQTWSPDPDTPRAVANDNFQRAVSGARRQVLDVWGDFQSALLLRYGQERGSTMIRALTGDTPWTRCMLAGSSPFAKSRPTGGLSSLRSVTALVDNRTGEQLTCSSANLRNGQWGTMPPDAVPAGKSERFRVESKLLDGGGGGPEGFVLYDIGRTGYQFQVAWDNPIVGSNKMTCAIVQNGSVTTSSPYRCTVESPGGDDAFPKFRVMPR